MKTLPRVILSFLLLLIVSGCSETIDAATENAIAACGIEVYETGIDDRIVSDDSLANGDYYFNPPSKESFWSIYDPLPQHKERADVWEKRAISASVASKSDSKYNELSKSSTALANANSRLVSILTQYENDVSLGSYSDWTFLDSYNDDLNTWSIECASIVEFLNR